MTDTAQSKGLNRAKIADWVMMFIVGGLLLWAAVSTFQPSPLEKLEGQPAPEFKLKTHQGDVVGPADYEGKVVLLDFWATWCEPCFKQMPVLEEVEEEIEDLIVLPVNVDDPSPNRSAAIDEFLEEAGTDRDTLIDTGTVADMYGIESIPALVLIGPDGTIRWTSKGVTARKRIVAEIRAARGGGDG